MTSDIKKILDEIDGLREMAEKSGEPFDVNLYYSSLRRNYPHLRKYIARLEWENEAERIFNFIRMSLRDKDDNKPIDPEGRILKHTIEQWLYHVEDAYRTACKEEKVK